MERYTLYQKKQFIADSTLTVQFRIVVSFLVFQLLTVLWSFLQWPIFGGRIEAGLADDPNYLFIASPSYLLAMRFFAIGSIITLLIVWIICYREGLFIDQVRYIFPLVLFTGLIIYTRLINPQYQLAFIENFVFGISIYIFANSRVVKYTSLEGRIKVAALLHIFMIPAIIPLLWNIDILIWIGGLAKITLKIEENQKHRKMVLALLLISIVVMIFTISSNLVGL